MFHLNTVRVLHIQTMIISEPVPTPTAALPKQFKIPPATRGSAQTRKDHRKAVDEILRWSNDPNSYQSQPCVLFTSEHSKYVNVTLRGEFTVDEYITLSKGSHMYGVKCVLGKFACQDTIEIFDIADKTVDGVRMCRCIDAPAFSASMKRK